MKGRKELRVTAGAVFRRLAQRGVPLEKYGTIKKIVAFDVPQWALFFSRQFEHRTVAEVLAQIERWRVFLSNDFLLFVNQKAELEKWIGWAEFLTLQTLMEANFPQVGAWKLEVIPVPTGRGESGAVYNFAAQRITAFNHETNQTRTALIPGDELNDPARRGGAYRKALESLGIWNLLWKGGAGRGLISARKPQGWPMFTQVIIPQLYEYLIPHYKERHHYSGRIDSLERKRYARFPKALLQDMLEILRMEHPRFFGATTIPQLKATIQKYLARKDQGTKSEL